MLIEGLVERKYLNIDSAYDLIPDQFEIWGLSTKTHGKDRTSRMFVNPLQPYLNKIYSAADFLVELEQDEGFNLTILEAMACGCVVITTSTGGHIDYCVHMKNAILLKNFGELPKYLEMLSKDHYLYNYLMGNAMDTTRLYTWKRSTLALQNFLHKILPEFKLGPDPC